MATRRIPVPGYKPVKGVKQVRSRRGSHLTIAEQQAYAKLKRDEYEISQRIKNSL